MVQAEGQLNLFSERLRSQAPQAASLCSPGENATPTPLVSVRRTFTLRPPTMEGEGSFLVAEGLNPSSCGNDGLYGIMLALGQSKE
jgi:hypothetical protein